MYNIKKIVFFILIAFICFFLPFFIVANAQSLWYPNDYTNLQPVSPSWSITIPSLTSEDCLGTDAFGNVQSGSCSGTSTASTTTYVRNSYSSRFSELISVTNVEDALDAIFDFAYVAPAISLTASPNSTVKEYGDPITSIAFTANTTKTSADITTVSFWRGGVAQYYVPSPTAGGGSENWTETTQVDSTTSFYARVSDGTSTTTSNTKSYTFVYPFYYGVGAQTLNEAGIKALTKSVKTKSNTTFSSSPVDEVYYISYPKSYGQLSSILDANGFETIDDYLLREDTFTMLDSGSVDYYIYEFENPTTQTDFSNQYKF